MFLISTIHMYVDVCRYVCQPRKAQPAAHDSAAGTPLQRRQFAAFDGG